jgi:hypothetical protein
LLVKLTVTCGVAIADPALSIATTDMADLIVLAFSFLIILFLDLKKANQIPTTTTTTRTDSPFGAQHHYPLCNS